MNLINALNTQVREILIREFSDKLVQKLLAKFKLETKDTDDVILSYIDGFDRIKESLPVEMKNVETYNYAQLKNVVNSKKIKSDIKKYFSIFKKKSEGVSNNDLKTMIRKFLDIQRFLPDNKKDLSQYDFLDLTEFLEKNFEAVMKKQLLPKFLAQPGFSKDAAEEYINNLFNVYNRIPDDTGLILDMSVEDIEHLVDGLRSDEDILNIPKKEMENIELVYDKGGIKIFQPKTKDQCIMLRNGRSWCTSRDGAGNLFYNYRFNNNLTLYYVINENIEFKDVNFAAVILVQPDGKMRLADGTNSGRYSGHEALPWDEIIKKLPWIADLKNLFVAKPLSPEEKERYNRIRSKPVGDNPIQDFGGNLDDVEFWIEVSGNRLNDPQYANLTPELQKKYISLGFDLTANQISNSDKKVLDYYTAKKIDSISTKSLAALNDADIALINLPSFKNIKEKLKSTFAGKISIPDNKLHVDNLTASEVGKFISLYGFEELFQFLPDSLTELRIVNRGNNQLIFEIPNSILRFKNLRVVYFDNCINNFPDFMCQLSEITIIGVNNNPNLKKLPECIGNLKHLFLINNVGNKDTLIPSSVLDRGMEIGDGIWDIEPLE